MRVFLEGGMVIFGSVFLLHFNIYLIDGLELLDKMSTLPFRKRSSLKKCLQVYAVRYNTKVIY